MGKSLEAEVTLFANESLKATLDLLGDELRFVLITSAAKVLPLAEEQDADDSELEGLKLRIQKTAHTKCVRCWHHREEVGTISAHPELCKRCEVNIEGDGEVRYYA